MEQNRVTKEYRSGIWVFLLLFSTQIQVCSPKIWVSICKAPILLIQPKWYTQLFRLQCACRQMKHIFTQFLPITKKTYRTMKWDQDQLETDNGRPLYRLCKPLWFTRLKERTWGSCLRMPHRYWRSGHPHVSSLAACERQVQKQPLR